MTTVTDGFTVDNPSVTRHFTLTPSAESGVPWVLKDIDDGKDNISTVELVFVGASADTQALCVDIAAGWQFTGTGIIYESGTHIEGSTVLQKDNTRLVATLNKPSQEGTESENFLFTATQTGDELKSPDPAIRVTRRP